MPVAVAILVRVLIQASTQVGILLVAEKLLSPLTGLAKRAVQAAFNMTEEEAEDTIANEIIDAFALIGIIGLSIKTKLPTKVAERLGFSSKGFTRRKPSSKLPAGGKSNAATNVAVARTARILTTAEATTVVNNAKVSLSGFKIAYDFLFKFLGVGFLGALVVAQWIDFGNWNSGAYQKKMQKVLATITFGFLVPDEDYRKTKTASADVFTKVFNAYKLEGAVGINDPFKLQSVVFTRDNLLDVVDQVGAGLLLSTGEASTKNVLLATQMMIVFKDLRDVPGGVVGTGAATAGGRVVKAFTGVVSQGVLGSSTVFKARPDDLIEDIGELQEAINNNIAPWIVALPNKIVFEIKVVSSVIVNGLRKVGQAHRVKSGTNTDGTDRFKTISNKFAIADLFFITASGGRSKLASIILGPTNAVSFQPKSAELLEIGSKVGENIITHDTDEINSVVSRTPTAAVEPVVFVPEPTVRPSVGQTAAATPTTPRVKIPPEPNIKEFFLQRGAEGRNRQLEKRTVQSMVEQGMTIDEVVALMQNELEGGRSNQFYQVTIDWYKQMVAAKTSAEAGETGLPEPSELPPGALEASTLFQFYQALGKTLPNIQNRSLIYQALGLGQSGLYTGTEEQNTKLLRSLQGKSI